jgi:hypothetical protein
MGQVYPLAGTHEWILTALLAAAALTLLYKARLHTAARLSLARLLGTLPGPGPSSHGMAPPDPGAAKKSITTPAES